MKLLFLILAGGNDIHNLDEKFQRESWPTQISEDIEALWIKGGNSEFLDTNSKTLYLNTDESDLLSKSVAAIKWALDNVEFDCLIRTNVSTYFHIESLIRFLNMKGFSSESYGGYLNLSSRNNSGEREPFIVGTGIFMGRKVARFVSLSSLDSLRGVPDDVALSRILFGGNGFKFIRIPRLNLSSHHLFFDHFYIRCKSTWNDFAAQQRIKLVHRYFSSSTNYGKIHGFLQILFYEFRIEPKTISSLRLYFNRIKSDVKYFLLNIFPNRVLRWHQPNRHILK